MSPKHAARKRVALIGGFRAAYRTSRVALTLLDRPSEFTVTLRDPAWYEWPRQGRRWKRISAGAYLLWALRAILRADIVIFTALFGSGSLFRILLAVAHRLRKRVVFDFYISVFDSQVRERTRYAIDSSHAKKLRLTDQMAIATSNPVLFLSHAERSYYTDLLSIDLEAIRSHVVPLVVPDRPRAVQPYASGDTEVPTVSWWGRLGNPLHGVEYIIEALRTASTAFDGAIRFSLFPSGPPEELARFMESVKSLPNVHVDAEATFENGRLTQFLLANTDLALGAFGGTEKAQIVPINKVVDALSYGIPCITGESAAFREQLPADCLTFVPHCDPVSLAAAIVRLLKDPEQLKRQGTLVFAQCRVVYGPQSFERAFLSALGAS